MAHLKDITGMCFGRLTALSCVGRGHNGEALWECACSCGNTAIVYGSALRAGKTLSCGCLQRENGRKQINHMRSVCATPAKTHGESKSRMYKIWAGMIQRCSNPNRDAFKYYGGRGIKVCKRWLDFNNFYSDMAQTYFEGASIDRIDNNKDYASDNCRWVPKRSQFSNRRNKVRICINGEEMTIQQAAAVLGVSKYTLYKRVRNGVI